MIYKDSVKCRRRRPLLYFCWERNFCPFSRYFHAKTTTFRMFCKKGTKISEILWPKVWQGNNILWLIMAHFLEISWWSISLCGFIEKRSNHCTFFVSRKQVSTLFLEYRPGHPKWQWPKNRLFYWKVQSFCKILPKLPWDDQDDQSLKDEENW